MLKIPTSAHGMPDGTRRCPSVGVPRWTPGALGLAAALLAACLTAEPPDVVSQREEKVLNLAFSDHVFADVNVSDGLAAMKVWIETIGRRRHVSVTVQGRVYDELAVLRQGLHAREIDLAVISARDYLSLAEEGVLEPQFMSVRAGKATEQYVLLARKNGGIGDVSALRDRSVLVQKTSRTNMASLWLETLLMEKGMPANAAKAKEVNKVTRAALPVFFGQADACVVNQNGLETLVELNPQVGKQLQVLATSSEILPIITCLRAGYRPSFLKDFLSAAYELNQDAAGRQVLAIFQVEGVVSFDPSYLDAVKDLLKRHHELKQHEVLKAEQAVSAADGKALGARAEVP
ncbi:MAG: phosphate/phosphite/phosphonate ABC transporter substrate-binding protein [Planctomycetes bacterium]|nr:phosphate/phosphite/phosphonate ABC transporter substrate-binding protein [Planctomycetota bacterium]